MGAGGLTTVLVGSNRFVDCETLIAIRGLELLRVSTNPLRVSLTTPPDLPSGKIVIVTENQIQGPPGDVRVVATDKSVAIFWADAPIVIATLVQPDTVSLRIDLRPIGVNLFDEPASLHIAGNTYSSNTMRGGKVAIGLG
jgi:hypothetical protein